VSADIKATKLMQTTTNNNEERTDNENRNVKKKKKKKFLRFSERWLLICCDMTPCIPMKGS
jgi:hypothetical protein